MSTSYQLSFYLRKSRSNKSAESDIYLRISVNNKRSALSINRKVDPRKWSSKSERALGKSPEAIELNNCINVLRNRVKNIHQDLVEKNKTVSSKSIIDEFKGVNKKQPKMTLEAFKEHNENGSSSGKSISKSTAKRLSPSLRDFTICKLFQYMLKRIILNNYTNLYANTYNSF